MKEYCYFLQQNIVFYQNCQFLLFFIICNSFFFLFFFIIKCLSKQRMTEITIKNPIFIENSSNSSISIIIFLSQIVYVVFSILYYNFKAHYRKMNTLCKKISSLLQGCDVFAAPILLRFQAEEEKKTKTGGFVSLILTIVLISAFSSSWIAVFSKTDIKCQYQTITQTDPSPLNLNSNNMAIAIGFNDIDLNANSQKYLDIQFYLEKRVNGALTQSAQIEMVPCQQSHFRKFSIQYKEIYLKHNLRKFLCLPHQFNMTIQGKWVSENFDLLSVHVKNCTSNCVTQSQFESFISKNGGFNIKYYFVNKLINPTLKEPISQYFEDKYFSIINNQISLETNLYISEYQIETDESLLPITSLSVNSGLFVDRTQKEQFVRPPQPNVYSLFNFRKSDQRLKVSRIYRKIDDMLSYIGGLFGILIAIFGFLLVNYNKCCYELEMSNKLFKSQDQGESKKEDLTEIRQAVHCTKGTVIEPKEQKSAGSTINFNFWVYIKYMISHVAFFFISQQKWAEMKKINERLQQTQNQMNLDVILQKIELYERTFQCLFSQNQMTLLMLQQKISIQQLKQQRMIMNFEDQNFLIRHQSESQNQSQQDGANQVEVNFNKDRVQVDELMLQIYSAIDQLNGLAEDGDEVSQKILAGLREDIKKKYEQYCSQLKGKIRVRNKTNLSKFYGNTILLNGSTKKLTKIGGVKQTNIKLRKIQNEVVEENIQDLES